MPQLHLHVSTILAHSIEDFLLQRTSINQTSFKMRASILLVAITATLAIAQNFGSEPACAVGYTTPLSPLPFLLIRLNLPPPLHQSNTPRSPASPRQSPSQAARSPTKAANALPPDKQPSNPPERTVCSQPATLLSSPPPTQSALTSAKPIPPPSLSLLRLQEDSQ